MAEFQNFRSALNGFHREDVVHYIAYLNNRHAAEQNQMRTELQTMRAKLDALSRVPTPDAALTAQLNEANARCAELTDALAAQKAAADQRCAELEQELALLRGQLAQAGQRQNAEELEAYRRAERTERMAQERVTQLYAEVNGALADATVQVDEAAAQVTAVADSVSAELAKLQAAVTAGKGALQSAATTLYAVRPIGDTE